MSSRISARWDPSEDLQRYYFFATSQSAGHSNHGMRTERIARIINEKGLFQRWDKKPEEKLKFAARNAKMAVLPGCPFSCTHAARRTFICFALSSGIPPQVVMKWTGHSDYQAMKPYIEIAEKTKADAMKLFEQEMEK